MTGGWAAIRAVAGYLPPDVAENDMTTRAARALGIEKRHLAGDSAASDLAVAAAEALFRQHPEARERIDFVLLCTQQPDYPLPQTAGLVAEALGLPHSVGALDYNLGCSGYVYGLALAKGLIECGLSGSLLLLTASLYTRDVSARDMATALVFGDGAAATLIERVPAEQGRPPLSGFAFGTDGSGAGQIIQRIGGSRHPWRTSPPETIRDAHGEHTTADIFMDGQQVMLFTLREVPPLVDKVLAETGLSREQLDYCVFHQPNEFMLDYVQKKCRLEGVPFYNNVRETGNTVACTIPLGLADITASAPSQSLRRVLLAGFGVGLSWAGCIADLGYMECE